MKIVVIGSEGLLGKAVVKEFKKDGYNAVIEVDREHVNLERTEVLKNNLLDTLGEFDVMINCAGMVNMEECEKEPVRAVDINMIAPRIMASVCETRCAQFIHFSTDYVFGGDATYPYSESHDTNPLSTHALSKSMGERAILRYYSRTTVVRTSRLFGPGRFTIIDRMLDVMRQGLEVSVVNDKYATPTYTVDLARWIPLLFGRYGTYHLTNSMDDYNHCSYYTFIDYAAVVRYGSGYRIKRVPMKDVTQWTAKRPAYSHLSIDKFKAMTSLTPRGWRDAVREYVEENYGGRV